MGDSSATKGQTQGVSDVHGGTPPVRLCVLRALAAPAKLA